MKNFAHETNPHVAEKVQTILDNAELAFLLNGTPHAEFYRRERVKHHGLARRILDRLTELGSEDSIQFSNEFFKDMGL
jgi:hypothetical protein